MSDPASPSYEDRIAATRKKIPRIESRSAFRADLKPADDAEVYCNQDTIPGVYVIAFRNRADREHTLALLAEAGLPKVAS